MKVLIVGGGGREHALAWRFSRSPSVREVVACPGNPGIAALGRCIPVPADIGGYVDIAEACGADLTVVGPEASLVAGIVDHFRTRGLRIIGPTQAAARLEGSKIFAKQFLHAAGIPTARSMEVSTYEGAIDALRRFSFPVVVKADGLAAGKGVVIAGDSAEAESAVRQLGPRLVIEEFLEGDEVSFIGLSDGRRVVPFAPTQDHKRIFDGDQGPNTGGMGAYLDPRILTSSQNGQVMDRIMLRAVEQMGKQGTPFTGFLYAGLMMTADGPKVLEFNVRLGDPETQALMYALEGDLASVLEAQAEPKWDGCSVCIVLAAQGYPDQPRTGHEISGIGEAEAGGATVFQAGTKRGNGKLLTNGGRVLGVTAGASTLVEAIGKAYDAAGKIRFEGMQYRKDIGAKGLRRW